MNIHWRMNIERGNFGGEDRKKAERINLIKKFGVLHGTVQKRGKGGNECEEMME